jgi:hypothetical protein
MQYKTRVIYICRSPSGFRAAKKSDFIIKGGKSKPMKSKSNQFKSKLTDSKIVKYLQLRKKREASKIICANKFSANSS